MYSISKTRHVLVACMNESTAGIIDASNSDTLYLDIYSLKIVWKDAN